MELKGTIVKIKNIEVISAKTENTKDFQKREFWLRITNEKYAQTINLELHGESVAALDYFTEGQEIIVSINLKGRVVDEKCFNTLQAWRIQEVKKS